MINFQNNSRFDVVKSLTLIALVLTIATSTFTNTNSNAEEIQITNSPSTIIDNQLTWVEDNSEVFYPAQEDQILSEEEVQKLGLELKYNQTTSQDLKLEFKTDFKSELKLGAGLKDTASRQAELNLVSDKINHDFQAELKAKRDLEAKQYSEFNKITKLYDEATGIYNDLSKKVNDVLNVENKGIAIVTDVILDNIVMDKDIKSVIKVILNGNANGSDYQKYNFDHDLNRIKNLFK